MQILYQILLLVLLKIPDLVKKLEEVVKAVKKVIKEGDLPLEIALAHLDYPLL